MNTHFLGIGEYIIPTYAKRKFTFSEALSGATITLIYYCGGLPMSHKPFLGRYRFRCFVCIHSELWEVEYAASALYRCYHDTASLINQSEPLRLEKQLIDSIPV
jgi:hypothetical protein